MKAYYGDWCYGISGIIAELRVHWHEKWMPAKRAAWSRYHLFSSF